MPTCTINCDTQDAIIRYTTNGNDPTESDTVYSIPFSVDADTTVKAKAWKEGMNPSAVASAEAPDELQPTSVPLGSVLSDGSVVIYDRGSSYGDYNLTSGVLTRLSAGTDDETATSQNWRFLIADSADMEGNNGGVGENKPAGDGTVVQETTQTGVGNGLVNTNKFIDIWGSNDSYLWKNVVQKRQSDGLNWFLPNGSDASEINNAFNNSLIDGIANQEYFLGYSNNDYTMQGTVNLYIWNNLKSNSRSSTDCRVRLLRRY